MARDLSSRVYEGADVIDSRDVIERIEELESELAGPDLECKCSEPLDDSEPLKPDMAKCGACGFEWCARCHPAPSARCWNEEAHDEEAQEELAKLKALADEASGYAPDWHHGEALIADHYFKEYAEDLADDIGAIDRNASWPVCHIDWDAAADALKADYTSVEYGSTTYWIRS